MAGGGVKPGFSYGETDPIGYESIIDKVSVHDLHATLLELMGFDHEKLILSLARRAAAALQHHQDRNQGGEADSRLRPA